jgi:murein DD-endopeptidase MepM/ murein hydrolase activator NlpD
MSHPFRLPPPASRLHDTSTPRLNTPCPFTRRTFLRLMAAAGVAPRLRVEPAPAQTSTPASSYPLGFPGRPLGDRCYVRHGYATENTWYLPGWWHTGEDWYLLEGDTAGVGVYAAADGEVVYADANYPGRVVIVAHADELYSMYGHLDFALAVAPGQDVARGDLLGTVLERTDGRAPSHLHFELRTFFTTPEVNGDAPRYDVACGVDCPPGPGYWPMDAPEHPSAMGWRNPTHVIAGRAWPQRVPDGAEAVVATGAPASGSLWTAPADLAGAAEQGELALAPGDRYALRAVTTGPEDSTGTSAEAYQLWYRIALADGVEGWVQAALPSAHDTGSDGRPSSLRFALLPQVTTRET